MECKIQKKKLFLKKKVFFFEAGARIKFVLKRDQNKILLWRKGYADLDEEQYRTECVLQDNTTPTSRVDELVTNLIEVLIDMAFGNSEVGPAMLEATPDRQVYHLQKLMHQIINDPDFVSHDMDPVMLDRAWSRVKARGAALAAAWSKRFPDRQFLRACAIYDFQSNFGDSVAVDGSHGRNESFAIIEKHCCSSVARVTNEWKEYSIYCHKRARTKFNKHGSELTVEQGLSVIFDYLQAHDMDARPSTSKCLDRTIVLPKSSAMLERDFSVMRQIQKKGGVMLTDGNLDFRLKLKLNVPDVKVESEEATRFISEIVKKLKAEGVRGKRNVKRKGRPVGAKNKRDLKRKNGGAGVRQPLHKKAKVLIERAHAIRKEIYEERGYKCDPVKFIAELLGKEEAAASSSSSSSAPAAALPKLPSSLLKIAMVESEKRVEAINAAKVKNSATPAVKKVEADAKLSELPKVALKKAVMTPKEIVRYVGLLMGFAGKANAEIKINVSKFADAYMKHHIEKKTSIIDITAEVHRLHKKNTEEARFKWYLEVRTKLKKG